MVTITYVEFDGTRHTVDVRNGLSLMEGAVFNNVPGIEGDCGGLCACATCHVFLPEDWAEWVPAKEDMEERMLDFAFDVQEGSRLACQIEVTDEIDGLEVMMPERQY
ncbi:MAG: 2Fe-2S iron-sulfur cluster-binding protein [Gammaproteobacteria bacterium]|nr:2Fe-2S iron-sulfur cluster-binding protein [Gammaproteobacteria bacterium]